MSESNRAVLAWLSKDLAWAPKTTPVASAPRLSAPKPPGSRSDRFPFVGSVAL